MKLPVVVEPEGNKCGSCKLLWGHSELRPGGAMGICMLFQREVWRYEGKPARVTECMVFEENHK